MYLFRPFSFWFYLLSIVLDFAIQEGPKFDPLTLTRPQIYVLWCNEPARKSNLRFQFLVERLSVHGHLYSCLDHHEYPKKGEIPAKVSIAVESNAWVSFAIRAMPFWALYLLWKAATIAMNCRPSLCSPSQSYIFSLRIKELCWLWSGIGPPLSCTSSLNCATSR